MRTISAFNKSSVTEISSIWRKICYGLPRPKASFPDRLMIVQKILHLNHFLCVAVWPQDNLCPSARILLRVFYCINSGYYTFSLWLTLPRKSWFTLPRKSWFTLPRSIIFRKIYVSGQALNSSMKVLITCSSMTSTYLCTKVILNFFEFLKILGKCVHTKNLLCAAKCDILSRPIKFFSCASSSILSAQTERTWSLYSWNGEWVCLLVANECANNEKSLNGQYVGWDYWVCISLCWVSSWLQSDNIGGSFLFKSRFSCRLPEIVTW